MLLAQTTIITTHTITEPDRGINTTCYINTTHRYINTVQCHINTKQNLIEECARSSSDPIARRTYEGSSEADVQALQDDDKR